MLKAAANQFAAAQFAQANSFAIANQFAAEAPPVPQSPFGIEIY